MEIEASFWMTLWFISAREAQAAVFLRDVEAEELVLLDVIPQLRRQVGAHVGDVPVVGHAAQLFARAVEEGLFFRGEFGLGSDSSSSQSGLPENSSPSNPTVPASSAVRSVSDSGGRIFV